MREESHLCDQTCVIPPMPFYIGQLSSHNFIILQPITANNHRRTDYSAGEIAGNIVGVKSAAKMVRRGREEESCRDVIALKEITVNIISDFLRVTVVGVKQSRRVPGVTHHS